jgi:glucose/arabinose dehydrogenase
VLSGLVAPVDLEFAPDGRLFIAEQAGRVRIQRPDGTLATFADLRPVVDHTDERGLLGIAFDPDFATNHFVYLDFTRKATAARGTHNRVVRFTARGNKAVAGSGKLIFALDDLPGTHHLGGSIDFGADGFLYVSSGDNQVSAKAQQLTTLLGKVLRIKASGAIPHSNPFYDRAAGRNRAIWARGLRNPFKIAFRRGTDTLFINDVGEQTWEEINLGASGKNYGWPVHEGDESAPAYTPPIYAYHHGSSARRGCAITGGTFYDPASASFPSGFVGDYFYADFCGGWVRRYDPADDSASAFATGFPSGSVVDLEVGPGGALYVLRLTGQVTRIRHTG